MEKMEKEEAGQPKYKALKRGYDGFNIVEKGQEFYFDGPPSKLWMRPVNEEAKAKFKEAGFPVAEKELDKLEADSEPKKKRSKEPSLTNRG